MLAVKPLWVTFKLAISRSSMLSVVVSSSQHQDALAADSWYFPGITPVKLNVTVFEELVIYKKYHVDSSEWFQVNSFRIGGHDFYRAHRVKEHGEWPIKTTTVKVFEWGTAFHIKTSWNNKKSRHWNSDNSTSDNSKTFLTQTTFHGPCLGNDNLLGRSRTFSHNSNWWTVVSATKLLFLHVTGWVYILV